MRRELPLLLILLRSNNLSEHSLDVGVKSREVFCGQVQVDLALVIMVVGHSVERHWFPPIASSSG